MPSRMVSTDYFGDDDSSIAQNSTSSISKSPNMYEGASERSPLLSPQRGEVLDAPPTTPPPRYQSRETITLIFMLCLVLVTCGNQIMESPETRIFESIICYRHYEQVDPSKIQIGREGVGPGAIGGVKEMYCKENAVQGQLAMLRGYQQLFDGFPALLLAVPFGWAADRYGRKPVLTLGLFSFVLRAAWLQFVTWFWQAFDIRLTWLSTLHALLGGGSPVVTGFFFVVLSDVAPAAERAGIFLRASAFSLLAAIVIPPLAAWLMVFNPWIPRLAGTVFQLLGFLVALYAPETLNFMHQTSPLPSRPATPSAESMPAPPDMANVGQSINANFAARWLTNLREATSFITADWRIPALVLPFIGHILIGATGQLLVQYMSKRYLLTVSKATLVLTIFSSVKVLLLFLILPAVSTVVLQTFHLSVQRKDLYLARTSQLFTVLGFVLIGLSPNVPAVIVSMVVASLGQGALSLLRSFLSSLVEAHHIARVYSVITVVDTLGSMFGGALLAGLFQRGLVLGGGWIGLPFYFIGLMCATFAVLMFAVKLRKGEDEQVVEENDDNL